MEIGIMKPVVILLLAILVCSLIQAQEPVKIKENTPFWYLYMEFQDSHYLIPDKVGPFIQEIRKQGIQSKVEGDIFTVFFDSPVIVEGRGESWGLGFKIAPEIPVELPLKKQRYDYQKIATIIHKGPFETAPNSFNILLAYLEECGLEVVGPPVEIWIGDPAQDKPEDLKTEIILPVREKKK